MIEFKFNKPIQYIGALTTFLNAFTTFIYRSNEQGYQIFLEPFIVEFIDDILVHSKSQKKHEKDWNSVANSRRDEALCDAIKVQVLVVWCFRSPGHILSQNNIHWTTPILAIPYRMGGFDHLGGLWCIT